MNLLSGKSLIDNEVILGNILERNIKPTSVGLTIETIHKTNVPQSVDDFGYINSSGDSVVDNLHAIHLSSDHRLEDGESFWTLNKGTYWIKFNERMSDGLSDNISYQINQSASLLRNGAVLHPSLSTPSINFEALLIVGSPVKISQRASIADVSVFSKTANGTDKSGLFSHLSWIVSWGIK